MLYLMRKPNESIIINNDIELKVVEIKGKSVKLGFVFPKGASVLRKELYDKIVAENKAAAKGDITVEDILSSMPRVGSKGDSEGDDDTAQSE